jgi:iron-sulfur cluster assembly accessory protein
LEEEVQTQEIEFTEFDEDESLPLIFTNKAIQAAKDAIVSETLKPGESLRVGLRGGGCAGFSYVLDFTDSKPNDLIMDFEGLVVYLDPMSAMHLEGTTIDYVTSLMGMGFKFINPNATKTCGCGSSFG